MLNSGKMVLGALLCLGCAGSGGGNVWGAGQGGSAGLGGSAGESGGPNQAGKGGSNSSGGGSSGSPNGGTSSGSGGGGTSGGAGGTVPTGGTGGTGGTAVSSCNPNGTFGEPVPIGELNTAADEAAARLTSNELIMVFDRDGDLFMAERASRVEEFVDLGPIPGIENVSTESAPWISDDLLTLFYERTDDDDISMTTRTDRSLPFNPSTPLGLVALGNATDPYAVGGPNGWLYFTGDDAIVAVGLQSWLPLGAPSDAQTPTLTPNFVRPVVSSDQLTIFATEGDLGDILRAQRSAPNAPFGDPVVVSELITADNEYASWISPDGCRLYFDTGLSGARDLFVAQILP